MSRWLVQVTDERSEIGMGGNGISYWVRIFGEDGYVNMMWCGIRG